MLAGYLENNAYGFWGIFGMIASSAIMQGFDDICLLNLPNGKQVAAYPSKDGPVGPALDWITDEARVALDLINEAMLKTARTYPSYAAKYFPEGI